MDTSHILFNFPRKHITQERERGRERRGPTPRERRKMKKVNKINERKILLNKGMRK
jgi:hypothetical protein